MKLLQRNNISLFLLLRFACLMQPGFKILYLPSSLAASSHQLSSMVSSASSDNLSDERLMIRRVSSGASIAGHTFVTVYSSMWQALNELAADPHLEVAAMSRSIITAVKKKVCALLKKFKFFSFLI